MMRSLIFGWHFTPFLLSIHIFIAKNYFNDCGSADNPDLGHALQGDTPQGYQTREHSHRIEGVIKDDFSD